MLTKIHILEEIGRFSTLKQKCPNLAKLSLIYARNGFGKSTLCAVLRSATTDDPAIIKSRRRVQATRPCRVQTSWANGTTATFSGDSWSAWPGRVHVFDQDYVTQNLFVGEHVTRDNKRSLLPIVLGQEGVALAQKISDLDKEQRELDATKKECSDLITAKFSTVKAIGVATYCNSIVPSDLEALNKIALTELELAKQASAVKQRGELPNISVRPLSEFEELLGRTINDVSADAALLVTEHLEKHGLEPNARRWIKYGIDNNGVDTCPYCDQDTKGLPLMEAYGAYFSDTFVNLSGALETARKAVSDLVTRPTVAERCNSIETEISFWKGVCTLPLEPQLSQEDSDAVQTGIEQLAALLTKKVANPLAKLDLGASKPAVETAYTLLGELNSGLELCEATIAEARTAAETVNVKDADAEVRRLEALSGLLDEDVKEWVNRYNIATKRRKVVEEEKKVAQKELRTYAIATVGTRQNDINNMLANFGANFSIVDTKANFKGREPNAEFVIEIANHKIPVGEKKLDEPSFGTVLSSGDKTTLALAFFLTQVLADDQLEKAVVILDDPFNSQDLNRQFETTSQIRAISEKTAQTIVFSHDPRFLHMIEKDSDDSTTSTFQLRCKDDGEGALTQWRSSDTLKNLYVRQSEIIREFATHGKPLKGEDANSVKQVIRPFLEDYIRARFPARFDDMAMLKGMIEGIEKVGTDDPLFASCPDLTSLNEYTRPNMHGGAKAPDETELRAQCKKVVRIVGNY